MRRRARADPDAVIVEPDGTVSHVLPLDRAADALRLQRPLADGMLQIVAEGVREDAY